MTRTFHQATLGVLALMLSAAFALPLHAQDRSDQRRDQPTPDHQAQPDEHRTQPTQSDEHRAQPDVRRAPQDEHRDARPEERRGPADDVDALRHAHPHAAARCHDGFFTNTRDRGRACSKHGGIDIWLAL